MLYDKGLKEIQHQHASLLYTWRSVLPHTHTHTLGLQDDLSSYVTPYSGFYSRSSIREAVVLLGEWETERRRGKGAPLLERNCCLEVEVSPRVEYLCWSQGEVRRAEIMLALSPPPALLLS